MTTNTKIEDWARQLAAATPSLDHEQQRIAHQIYHLIAANAEPVTVAQIADSAKVLPDRVEESLRSWPLVLWDDQHRVVGFWGIHANHITPTHAIDVDGTTVYAWCAWDTLFITEILGRQTQVLSADPQNREAVRLTVAPDGVTSVEPPDAVVSLLLPEDGLTDDAIQRFCHKVHFFTSPESAEAWIDGRPGLFHVNVDEAFRLGRVTNRLRMGAILDDVDREPLMEITVQYFDDCPNWKTTAAHLNTLADDGLDATIDYELIDTPELAAARGFHGSPTVLIDGVDPFSDNNEPVGLACRVYQTEDGYAGSPTLDQLRAVIASAEQRS